MKKNMFMTSSSGQKHLRIHWRKLEADMSTKIKIEKMVQASPEQVYYAFIHAASLTEWLCDYATVVPRSCGRMYLWWHGDYYSAGEYISLRENESVIFKWQAREDPQPSQVEVTLAAKDGGTLVTLAHTLPEGQIWAENARHLREEWTRALENLAQVLETGLDKRTFDRPMLGVNISDFNAEIAKAMGVPVKDGMRLDFLPEEMGAYKAGLRKDDVLVGLAGHAITNDFGSLISALQGKKCGEKVETVFYRGPEKRTVVMELSPRPIPSIPWDAKELGKTAKAKYAEGLSALEKALEGVSEAEADQEPAENEWSAKETLAHLIHNERHWLENLDDVIGGYPRVADDWTGNSTIHVKATVAAFKTIRGLLDELIRLADEMVAYTSTLPAEVISRKADYFLTVNMLLEGSLPHILSHLDQIENAIAVARRKQ
jgi:uncharacterized protein YndB with AHSA1/START domain/uncharacterized damage-inducible protein DinB